jgi:hypothetical protein
VEGNMYNIILVFFHFSGESGRFFFYDYDSTINVFTPINDGNGKYPRFL